MNTFSLCLFNVFRYWLRYMSDAFRAVYNVSCSCKVKLLSRRMVSGTESQSTRTAGKPYRDISCCSAFVHNMHHLSGELNLLEHNMFEKL